jgi:hypothetical protein
VERGFPVHAGAHHDALIVVALALALASSVGVAAPKGATAKQAFDKGVKAYKAGDYATASEAMSRSYGLEKDPETLFAWAQSERKLEHCDKAIDLYNQLLAYDLPAQNKHVIETQIGECKQILAKATAPVEPPKPSPPPSPPSLPPPPPPPPSPPAESRAWWRDPIGDGLVGAGVVGVVVGGIELSAASSADSHKAKATTYADFKKYSDDATSKGRIGVIAAGTGGALIVGGIVWYVTHRDRQEPAVTGWLGPTGGGLALGGSF